jgi:hypothetical protein
MTYTHRKWKEDLTKDIRTFTDFDDQDSPIEKPPKGIIEFSDCNTAILESKFLEVRDHCKAILEIGVFRNGSKSSTNVFLNNKLSDTTYIGIDIQDKSFLNNSQQKIFTIKNDSSNYIENIEKIKSFGVTELDFIFIDGWHSINQVMKDWEYTNILSNLGIIGFHDTNIHPGPITFLNALNNDNWIVEKFCTQKMDYGISFVASRL